MKVKEGQIFNLMDTNGRRNDVINALQGYLSILDEIQNKRNMHWDSMPGSLAQYEFTGRQWNCRRTYSVSMNLMINS